jgi:hypothetical protein
MNINSQKKNQTIEIPIPYPNKNPIINSNFYRKQEKQINLEKTSSEYDEKANFFDPSKQSPPNEFMLKLQMRMLNYSAVDNDNGKTLGINCDNFVSE